MSNDRTATDKNRYDETPELPASSNVRVLRNCRWLHLPSIEGPERFCAREGHPYCPEHRRELDAVERADSWDEILGRHRAVCGKPIRDRGLHIVGKPRTK